MQAKHLQNRQLNTLRNVPGIIKFVILNFFLEAQLWLQENPAKNSVVKLMHMQILHWNFILLHLKHQKTVAFLASPRIQILRRVMFFLRSGLSNLDTLTLSFMFFSHS